MPTDEDRDASATVTDNAPPAGATPTFGVGEIREAFRGLAKELLDEAQTRFRAAPAPRQAAPEPEGPTQEEFDSLDPNQRNLVDKAIRHATHGLRQEIGQLRDLGLARIGDLTSRQMAETLPYYKDYKTEIEAEMSGLDAALRTDPNTISIVHDRVAMRHEPERIKKIQDEAIRSARGDAPAPSSNTSRGSVRDAVRAGAVPTPEEIGFNDDQLAEIDRRGGPDAFARHISSGRIPDWKAYTEKYANFRAARGVVGGMKGRVIPFARQEPPTTKRTA